MIQNYSILINSCDAYSDVWPMFFHIFCETWKGQIPRVYLNTESKSFQWEGISLTCLNAKQKDISWGERLLNCLYEIDSEYVLMMLEDFYYESEINVTIIETCVEYLKDYKDVAAFQFVEAGECCDVDYIPIKTKFSGFTKRQNTGRFKIIAGPTLWRKSDLINLTRKSDNPWEWEYFGSYRTWFYGKEFYSWVDKECPVFKYDIIHGGAIHRGKWVGYKVSELARKYDFPLVFGDRKIEEDWLKAKDIYRIVPSYKRIPIIISNRLKCIMNIIYGIFLHIKEWKNYKLQI